MKITGGYTGFYNNYFIRSSYEYVYCIILEKLNLNYTVEEYSYILEDGSQYKPDFHIYKENKLIKIVEIKSSKPVDLQKANIKKELLSKQIKVPIVILEFKDLNLLCKELGLHIYSLIEEWKTKSIGRNINSNELNPMYNKQQSEKTKLLIGEKCKERNLDIKYRNKTKEKVLEYYKNGGKAVGPPRKRKILICPICNCSFEVIQSSNQKYCSKQCLLKDVTLLANNSTRNRFNILHNHLKQSLFLKFKDNIKLLESKKRNKIYFLVKEVFKEHNIKDIRIFKFLFLKSYLGSFEDLYNAFCKEFQDYLKYMPNLQDSKLQETEDKKPL